ncbi:MAG: gliding motility lipoprotein GldH [Prevotellaceae bacterium]|jgi:gliding motility-associated lipoprotein GldH|nr:gliding motility lipoprotein GldH [Prevotellaceae bacterium]
MEITAGTADGETIKIEEMPVQIKHKCFIALFFTIPLLSSCTDENRIWQQNVTVADCLWNRDTLLKFSIPVEDTVSWYSLSIDLRNRTDYSFQNLYLFLNIKAPNGNTTADTLNFMLAYDDGSWTGSGGLFSKYRENTFLYREYIRFPERGDYSVNIRHGMRKDDLKGISSVGLTLSYSEKLKQ